MALFVRGFPSIQAEMSRSGKGVDSKRFAGIPAGLYMAKIGSESGITEKI